MTEFQGITVSTDASALHYSTTCGIFQQRHKILSNGQPLNRILATKSHPYCTDAHSPIWTEEFKALSRKNDVMRRMRRQVRWSDKPKSAKNLIVGSLSFSLSSG